MNEKSEYPSNITPEENSSNTIPYCEDMEAEIYENLDWKTAKNRVLDLPFRRFPSDDYHDNAELLNLALQMRKFDQERFDNDKDFIRITHEEMGKYLIEDINNNIEELSAFPSALPGRFLELAAPTKEWNPKRFELEVRMEEKHLENIAELIERCRHNPMLFVHYYQLGLTLDAKGIRKRVNIDKSYSDQIRQRAEKDIQKGTGYKSLTIMDAWFWATIDSHKWEELPEITVSQEQERIMIQNLRTWVSQGACSSDIFKFVNALKNKEISVED